MPTARDFEEQIQSVLCNAQIVACNSRHAKKTFQVLAPGNGNYLNPLESDFMKGMDTLAKEN